MQMPVILILYLSMLILFLHTTQIFLSKLKFIPNPTENIINIVTENNVIELLEITNSLGQAVIRKESQNNILKVDISKLEYGTYLLHVLSQETYLNKIIIKK